MKIIAPVFLFTALVLCAPARADVRDLGSLSREIRFALADHGRTLTKPERKAVRFELAKTIVTVERITGRKARAGYTLQGLATTAQRLFDRIPNTALSPAVQKQLERRLSRCANLLERRERR